jgi:hypothetical protein
VFQVGWILKKVDPIVHPMGFFLMTFDSKSGREWATNKDFWA